MTVSRLRAAARTDAQKSQGERPAKLTATDKRQLVWMVTSGKVDNPVKVAQGMKDTIGVETSAQTVRRALREARLKAAVKKRKLRMLPRHVRQRMEFALRH